MGNILFEPRHEYPDLPAGMLTAWDFENVDISAEHKGAKLGMRTVKDYAIEHLKESAEFVVDDDRSGEVADLVIISERSAEGSYAVTLVHLKASKKPPGVRVDDLYEVLGQASRSVVWCDGTRMAARLLDRLKTGTSVVYGDASALHALLTVWSSGSPHIRWTVASVQPGLVRSLAEGSSNVKIMLNDFLEWVSQHGAEARIWAHG
jgi:hypothetical protein